jgi:hypothetical protein
VKDRLDEWKSTNASTLILGGDPSALETIAELTF